MPRRRVSKEEVVGAVGQMAVGLFSRALEGALDAVLGEVQEGLRSVDEKVARARRKTRKRASEKPRKVIEVEVVDDEGRRH